MPAASSASHSIAHLLFTFRLGIHQRLPLTGVLAPWRFFSSATHALFAATTFLSVPSLSGGSNMPSKWRLHRGSDSSMFIPWVSPAGHQPHPKEVLDRNKMKICFSMSFWQACTSSPFLFVSNIIIPIASHTMPEYVESAWVKNYLQHYSKLFFVIMFFQHLFYFSNKKHPYT